jgi:hypothetical protein
VQTKQRLKNKILAEHRGEGTDRQGGAQQGAGARGEQYLYDLSRSHILVLRILFGTSQRIQSKPVN